MFRRLLPLAALLLSTGPAVAQSVTLAEAVQPGDVFQYDLTLAVKGQMKVDRNGKTDAVPVAATASHSFAERVEGLTASGAAGKVVRLYAAATSAGDTGLDRTVRTLSPERRLVVAQRTEGGTLHYSPDGPLRRDELELVAEHFDTLAVTALLPPGPVAVGATWPVPADAAQALLHFEGVVKAGLVGTLTAATDATATFTVAGAAEGLEGGALAKVRVTATATFDRKANRLVGLEWKQTDERAQGPASPAADVTATVTLKRTPLAAEPKALAEGRAKVPADDKPTPVMTALRYADDKGRYSFVYDRAWHVVGRTDSHLVLRLLDKGEFVAQATVTAWKKAAPGGHVSADEFKAVLGQLPGWEPAGTTADGLVPTDAGRWLYRVGMQGKQDGLAVAQTFYALAGPNGDQVLVTVLARPEAAGKVGVRDVALVNAIEFAAK